MSMDGHSMESVSDTYQTLHCNRNNQFAVSNQHTGQKRNNSGRQTQGKMEIEPITLTLLVLWDMVFLYSAKDNMKHLILDLSSPLRLTFDWKLVFFIYFSMCPVSILGRLCCKGIALACLLCILLLACTITQHVMYTIAEKGQLESIQNLTLQRDDLLKALSEMRK